MKARYISHGQYECQQMTIGNEYEVISIEGGDYRIISDDYDPYLFEPERVELINKTEPDFWIHQTEEQGGPYSGPKRWSEPGFFEDFFDDIEPAVIQFWEDCETLYGISKNV